MSRVLGEVQREYEAETEAPEVRERMPPPRAASARGQRARTAILDGALDVAAEVGLGRASLSAVAARAGTSKTSVLYHFRSLQGLHRQMAVRVRERMEVVAHEAAPAKTGSLEERIRQVLEAVFRAEHRSLLLAMNEILVVGSRDPVIAAEVRANYRRATEIVERLLHDAPERVRALAPSLLACAQGHVDLWLWSGDADPQAYGAAAVEVAQLLVRASLQNTA